MPGKRPDLHINIKSEDGHLKEVAAVWKQEKGHYTGKLKLEGKEFALVIFPDSPKPKAQTAPDHKPAA